MRRLLVLSIIVSAALAPAEAQARRRRGVPQAHEIRLDFDFGVANRANASYFDALYLWTPQPLNSEDIVVPQVRRFVAHPTEIYGRASREGSTLDTRTSAHVGGTGYLLDGALYGHAQIGIELDDVRYDGTEGGYTTAPYRLEVGGRPTPLLQVGAYYAGRPIVDAYRADALVSTEREGGEYEVGGVLTFATPEDRALARFSFGYHRADWMFRFYNAGEMDVSGYRATAALSYQTSASFSWIVRAAGAREFWDNDRLGQASIINPPFEETVWSLTGDAGIFYWHEQRYGFRFTVGGAFEGHKPVFNGDQRGYFRFGFGTVLRF
jgi:hypothetical protein